MLPIITIVGSIIIAAIIVAFLNFRFLTYPLVPSLNPAPHATQLTLIGNTLFISDLHLKSNQPFTYSSELRNFLEKRRVSNLVINGDLFDSPENAQEILRNPSDDSDLMRKLGLDGLSLNVLWVLGSPAHDPPSPPNGNSLGNVKILEKCMLIDFGQMQVLAYHGHDLSLKGALGHAWNRFISNLSLERLWKLSAKVDRSVWVFFGHTHIPGADSRVRVANSGGWQKVPFVQPTNTGIFITADRSLPEIVKIA